jgi:type II secretory pathway component PulF
MGRFTYRARTEQGGLVTGEMDADSRMVVYDHLDGQGLVPVQVVESKSDPFSLAQILERYQTIRQDDLIFFTRQLQTIVKAGIPLISGLKALEEQTENPKLKRIIKEIYQEISKGKSLSDVLSNHPRTFSELYVSMIRAGEIGGVLDDVLGRLIGMLEFQMKTREMLKAAMRYPVTVVCVLVLAFIVIVTFIIPRFATIFKGANVELPLPTKIMLWINDMVHDYGIFLLIIGIALIAGGIMYIRSENGKVVWDRLKLRMPLVGQILLKIVMSRFANMFENMIRAGVPIMRTLEIVSRTVGNEYVARKIVEVSSKVEKGRGISKPLKDSGVFPPLVIHLISTGEETGSLEQMLREVSVHYDTEITYSVSRLSAWIEPVLTAGLSVMVLFIALAVFLPWWNMMEAMKGGGQ